MLISNNGSVESIMDMDEQKYIVDLRFFWDFEFFLQNFSPKISKFFNNNIRFSVQRPQKPYKT